MEIWFRKHARCYAFLLLCVIGYAPTVYATSDVESPEDQLKYLRVLLASSVLIDDIQYYAEQGCTWDSEVIWFGAPSTTESDERLHYGGITIFFKNDKNEEELLSYFFRLTDTDELYELKRNPKSLLLLSC